MEAAVRMENICKSFSGVKVLQNVNFTLEKGEIHALIGANGAGKSTLIKILSGAYTMDSGSIFIDGKEVKITSPIDSKANGVQCIYQELSLAPDLSIADNIFLGQELMNSAFLDEKTMNREAAALMKELDLDVDVRTKVRDVGIGEKFFTEISRCLVSNARVVILDEPTSAMTPKEYSHFLKTIKTLRERGISIIYISHHLDEIFDICDRITILKDGQNVATSNIPDITMAEIIHQMLGKVVESGRRMITERDFSDEPVRLRLSHVTTRKVRDISFDLHKGEVLAVTGLLGAGKTELANAIFGEDRLISGQIEMDGTPLKIRHPAEAMKMGIALVNEDRKGKGLLQEFSIRNNISVSDLDIMSSKIGFVNQHKEARIADEMIEKLGVKCHSAGQPVKSLSGGNQQKVVLAKWLLRNPTVLLLDEPTRGIDVGSKDEIYERICRLSEQGISIILLSSELPEVLSLAHRIIILKDGEIKGEIAGRGATQNEILLIASGEN